MSLGHNRERQVRAILEGEEWFVVRAAGSLGDADLVAMRSDPVEVNRRLSEAMLIEVKATADGPWKVYGPAKRRALREAARRAGATAWVYWWPSRGKLERIPEADWPPDIERKAA